MLNLSLAMTAYLLACVILLPLSGVISNRFGTRTVFKAAIFIFGLSSALCAASTDVLELTLSRAIQGASGALMVPVGRIVIVQSTSRANLVSAFAWMITPAMVGPLMGPLLGGLLTTWFSWHWIFIINLPISIAIYIAATKVVPEIRGIGEEQFNRSEWILLSTMLSIFVATLELTRHQSIPEEVYLILLGVFLLAFILFCRQKKLLNFPLLNFNLLNVQTFQTSFWAGSLLRIGYGAIPFLMPLMLQVGFGYTAIEGGVVLLISGFAAFLTKTQTSKILRKYGFRKVLLWNGLLCVFGLVMCGLIKPNWGLLLITLLISIAAFFRSIQFNALAAIAYADMPKEKISSATTLNTTFQQLAVMFGISISVFLVNISTRLFGRINPQAFDFSIAFFFLAGIGLVTLPFYLRLDTNAGFQLKE